MNRESLAVTIDVSRLEPGVVLAEAVTGADGRVLLLAGSVLDKATIAALARSEVASVRISGSDGTLAAQRLGVTARLEYLFRHAGDEAAARMLFEAVLAHRLGDTDARR